jgi:hypothetical protein
MLLSFENDGTGVNPRRSLGFDVPAGSIRSGAVVWSDEAVSVNSRARGHGDG